MKKEIIKGNNFFLVKEQEGRKNLPCVIKSSGYTIDERAINENWLLTQVRTLPHHDRSNLPDPVVFEASAQSLKPYAGRTVYSLYLTPNCKGLEYAQEELSNFFNYGASDISNAGFSFVGHSKGGLLLSGVKINHMSKFVFINPTFGCIMGDEAAVDRRIDSYKESHSLSLITKAAISLYRDIVHIIGSRRPVDLDMAPGSKFLSRVNLSHLCEHHVMLIASTCPEGRCGLQDRLYRFTGNLLDLSKKGDGMVLLEDQLKVAPYIEKLYITSATHPTILSKPDVIFHIKDFLR